MAPVWGPPKSLKTPLGGTPAISSFLDGRYCDFNTVKNVFLTQQLCVELLARRGQRLGFQDVHK